MHFNSMFSTTSATNQSVHSTVKSTILTVADENHERCIFPILSVLWHSRLLLSIVCGSSGIQIPVATVSKSLRKPIDSQRLGNMCECHWSSEMTLKTVLSCHSRYGTLKIHCSWHISYLQWWIITCKLANWIKGVQYSTTSLIYAFNVHMYIYRLK